MRRQCGKEKKALTRYKIAGLKQEKQKFDYNLDKLKNIKKLKEYKRGSTHLKRASSQKSLFNRRTSDNTWFPHLTLPL